MILRSLSRIAVLIALVATLSPFTVAFAQQGTQGNTNPGGVQGNTNPSGNCANGGANCLENPLRDIDSLPELMTALMKAVVRIGSIVLVLALVYVGFLFVVAQGNEEKIRSARTALMWTVIGGLILLGAQSISMVIQSTVEKL